MGALLTYATKTDARRRLARSTWWRALVWSAIYAALLSAAAMLFSSFAKRYCLSLGMSVYDEQYHLLVGTLPFRLGVGLLVVSWTWTVARCRRRDRVIVALLGAWIHFAAGLAMFVWTLANEGGPG